MPRQSAGQLVVAEVPARRNRWSSNPYTHKGRGGLSSTREKWGSVGVKQLPFTPIGIQGKALTISFIFRLQTTSRMLPTTVSQCTETMVRGGSGGIRRGVGDKAEYYGDLYRFATFSIISRQYTICAITPKKIQNHCQTDISSSFDKIEMCDSFVFGWQLKTLEFINMFTQIVTISKRHAMLIHNFDGRKHIWKRCVSSWYQVAKYVYKQYKPQSLIQLYCTTTRSMYTLRKATFLLCQISNTATILRFQNQILCNDAVHNAQRLL